MEETVDSLLIEACEEEQEIEDGYFTENLKYLLDKDIDNDIENAMGSVFNSDSTTTIEDTANTLLNQLGDEINQGDYEFPKRMMSDEEFDEVMLDMESEYSDHHLDWCDDDLDNDEGYHDDVDTGNYNQGYDALFGDGS